MDRRQIDILLEKYLAGETSLNEETKLRTYFLTHESLPEGLEEYRVLFHYFENEKQDTYDKDVFLPKPKSYKWLKVVSGIAAVIVVLLVLQPFSLGHKQGSTDEAVKNTKALFMILGNAPQESEQSLDYFGELKKLKVKTGEHKPDTLSAESAEQQK